MKKLAILCTVVALTGQVMSADNEKDEGKDKKVPPGLAKKGGVPPGQAKKQGEAAPAETAPAVSAPATANTPSTPATAAAPAPTTVKPAASEPVKATTTAVKAEPKTAAKPATFAEQKAKLDIHARTINQAAKSSPAMQKTALQHISKETGVPLEQLQQQDKNHPDASATSLLLGNLIAKQSGAKVGELLRARENGKHWAEIAKAHNVEIDPLVQKSAHLAQSLQGAQPTGAR